MDRRTFLRTGTLGLTALVAGCQGDTSGSMGGDTESSTDTGTAERTATETATPTQRPAETETVTADVDGASESDETLTATEVGTVDRAELTPYTLSADDLGSDWERTAERVYGTSIDREFTNTETGTRIGTAMMRGESEDAAQSRLNDSLDQWGGGEEPSTTIGTETYEAHPSAFQTGVLFYDGRFLGFVGVALSSGEASVDTAIEYGQQLHGTWP